MSINYRKANLHPGTHCAWEIPQDDLIPGVYDNRRADQENLLRKREFGQQSLFLGIVHPRLSLGQGLVITHYVDVQLDYVPQA
jgi:hypothetical protein